ncbi:MAG: VanZ family protein [Acidobacteria bacterium]|nr:VanZ family protein [Acidobacteriota bacterium]
MSYTKSITFGRPSSQLSLYLPLMMGLAVIGLESTRTMGASHTGEWLTSVVNLFHPQAYNEALSQFNQVLRKCGHFLGYGMLGVIAARVWFAWMRRHKTARWSQVRFHAALSGIFSAMIVACCDEIHQLFLPGRGGCVTDVLIDTSGALLLNALYFALVTWQRKRLLGYRISERLFTQRNARLVRFAMYRARTLRGPVQHTANAKQDDVIALRTQTTQA